MFYVNEIVDPSTERYPLKNDTETKHWVNKGAAQHLQKYIVHCACKSGEILTNFLSCFS